MRFLGADGKTRFRLPDAARFLGKKIASEGMGASTRPAANFPKFTDATLPFQIPGIAQRDEEGRGAIELSE